MRWLFLFVLFINLAYVGWQLTVGEQYSSQKVAPMKNVKPIVLLSELEQAKTDTAAAPQAVEARSSEERVDTGTEATEGTKTASDDASSARSTEVKTKAKPASAIKSLADNDAATGDTAPVQTPRDERCFSLGPFTSIDKLGGLVRDMKTHVVQADFRSEETADDPLYWVYIKPAQSSTKAQAQAEAKQTASRLRARKIRDFYIIRDGDKQYGISLGRFRNKAGAYGLAKKISKAGFNVLVEPLERTRTQYWLDYELAPGAEIPASLFDQYINGDDNNKISRKSRVCP